MVNDQRARQLSQPRVDAQGKPIRQAPACPREARSEGGVQTAPPRQRLAAGSACSRGQRRACDEEPSKPDPNRTVRAVGPVFIPSTR